MVFGVTSSGTRTRRSGGFTLTELIVSTGIIVVLAALIAAGVGTLSRAAQRTACTAKLRTIGQGIALYAADNDGKLPLRWTSPPWEYWYMKIFPYLGDGRTITLGETLFQCPSARDRVDNNFWVTSCTYAYNSSVLGYGDNVWEPAIARDGVNLVRFPSPSRVLAVTEWPVEVNESWWTGVPGWEPNGEPPDLHGGIINALFLDGHVEPMKRNNPDLKNKTPFFDREANTQ